MFIIGTSTVTPSLSKDDSFPTAHPSTNSMYFLMNKQGTYPALAERWLPGSTGGARVSSEANRPLGIDPISRL
jgi:hypothetical protein